MKLSSKINSLLIVFVLLLNSVQAFAVSTPFKDIDGIPEKASIISLYDKGFVRGVGNDLYAPDSYTTVAEAIQFFVNFLDLNLDNIRFIKAPKATDYFKNADNDAWYADALIIGGIKCAVFPADIDPNQLLSKEEFTYYLTLAIENHYNLQMMEITPKEISDQNEIDDQYSGTIQRALYYGLVNLDDLNKFNPKVKIKRAEVAVQIVNAINYIDSIKEKIFIYSNLIAKLTEQPNDNGYGMRFEIENMTSEDLTLTFSSGQKYDYYVYDKDGQLVYQWSNGKMFTTALVDTILPMNNVMNFDEEWKYMNNEGNKVKNGEYRVVFTSTFNVNDEKITLQDESLIYVK